MSFAFTPPGSASDTTIYVRPGGSDLNSGALGSPLATVVEAFRRVQLLQSRSGRTRIDCSGVTEDVEEVIAPLYVSGYPSQLDVAPSGSPLFWAVDGLEIVAVPTVAQSLTINANNPGPTPGQVVLTVDEIMVPGEHVGRVVTTANPFQAGVVFANDANTLSVTTLDVLPAAGAIDVVERSATLSYGDPAIFSRIGLELAAVFANVTFTGIKFRNNNGGPGNYSLEARSRGNTSFVACDFVGANLYGPDFTFDYCNVAGDWQTNGAGGQFRSSLFQGVTFYLHGTAGFGTNVWNGNVFDGCSAIGHGTTQEQEGGFDVRSSLVVNAVGDGVRYAGGNKALIKDVVVNDAAGNGVVAENVGSLELDNVDGSGNGGVGLKIDRGASVQHAGASTIAGTGGEIDLAGTALTWGAIGPAEVDNNTGSRLLDIS